MRNIVIIAHNLRSSHNIGSLLRTADTMGIEKLYLTGYTPYPRHENDERLPHLANKTHAAISKIALGAEKSVNWQKEKDINQVIEQLKNDSFEIVALEQANNSIKINDFNPSSKIAIIVGREVEGVEPEVLEKCDTIIEIPMLGQKESLNVVQAAAIAMYHCRFY